MNKKKNNKKARNEDRIKTGTFKRLLRNQREFLSFLSLASLVKFPVKSVSLGFLWFLEFSYKHG